MTTNPAPWVNIGTVRQLTGLSKTTILRRIAANTFPAPVLQEKNVRGQIYLNRWDLSQILSWRDEQVRRREESLQAA